MVSQIDPLQRLASTWDEIVRNWLDGADPWSDELRPWVDSYSGTGSSKLQVDAIPEPFSGPIDKPPKAVLLALNPGRAFMGNELWSSGQRMSDLQSRQGRFAKEIVASGGSFTHWSSTPQDWKLLTGGPDNRFVTSRLRFVKDWLAPDPVSPADLVWFDMYPWHSYTWGSISAKNEKVCELIDRYVIQPIAALSAPWVFAFGKPWFEILPAVGFVKRAELGGEDKPIWANQTPSRRVGLFQSTTSGCWVLAMRHIGSAGPPKSSETSPLRDLICKELAILRRG